MPSRSFHTLWIEGDATVMLLSLLPSLHAMLRHLSLSLMLLISLGGFLNSPLIGWADDASDYDSNLDSWDALNNAGTTGESSAYQQPYQAYPNNRATSAVEPQPPANAPPVQKKIPWLQRLFTPMVKNPPILQPKKFPKEEGRETQAIAEPLLRLTTDVTYQGKVVPAGYYLIRFSTLPSSKRAFITLMQKNQPALSLLALKMEADQPSRPPSLNQQNLVNADDHQQLMLALDSPPENEVKPEPQANGKDDEVMPTETGPFVYTERSEDGQFLLLVYQVKKDHYISAPMKIQPGASSAMESDMSDEPIELNTTP